MDEDKEEKIFSVLPEELGSVIEKLRFQPREESYFHSEDVFNDLKRVKDFNTNFASLQNWFIRLSYHEKVQFILKLLKPFLKFSDSDTFKVFFDVFKITKDFLYGKTQYTHSVYDRTPMDQNRSKNLGGQRFQAESNGLIWFKSLTAKDQAAVIITLSQMGGGSLAYRSVREAMLLLEKENNLPKEKKKTSLLIPPKGESQRSVKSRYDSQKDVLEIPVKLSKFKSIAAKKEAEWLVAYASLLEKAGESDIEEKDESIDMLQMLPVSINRVIYSYLDSKSKANMKNLNRYWKTMCADIQKEEHVRDWINKLIRKQNLKSTAFKGRTWAPFSKPVKIIKLKKSLSFGYSERRASKTNVKGSVATLNQDDSPVMSKVWRTVSEPNFIYSAFELKTRSDFEITFKRKPFMKYPYTGKYTCIKISERYDHERALAANKQWIAISDGCDITLHSFLTGAPMIARLEGHSGYVSAIVFHPSKSRIFSGSYDATVRYWDVYSRSLIHEFLGHGSVITSLSVNEVFLCSASMDRTIKVFDLSSGAIMWSYECVTIPVALAIDKRQTLFAGSHVGHVEKIILSYDDFSKSVCPVEKLHESSNDKDNVTNMRETEEENMNNTFIDPDIKTVSFDKNDGQTVDTKNIEASSLNSSSVSSDEKIRFAHSSEITSIFVESPLIFTAGCDGVVHVWHYKYFESGPLMTLKHKGRRVNSVIVSYLLILTASEDGRLRIWDIETKSLKREIVVNPSGRPIISMACVEFLDHSKIVFNNEDGIIVMEFPYDWIKLKKLCSTKKKIKTPPKQLVRILTATPSEVFLSYNYKNLTTKSAYSEARRNDLEVRLETRNEIQATDSRHVISKNISPIIQASQTPGQMLQFDRYQLLAEKDSENVQVQIQEKEDPKQCLFKSQKKQIFITKKDILPCMNPSKKVL